MTTGIVIVALVWGLPAAIIAVGTLPAAFSQRYRRYIGSHLIG